MFTVAELTAAMKGSGRHLTPRTARNWWSVGVLPKPDRQGLGQGKGTVTFWRDRRVLVQAQLGYDLLGKGARLQNVAASLWLLGFPVPLKFVRKTFAGQIESFRRRARRNSRGGSEECLWELTERFVRQDARARGFSKDREAQSLYDLTGLLLELLFGVGDGAPPRENDRQWAVDTASELIDHLDRLAPTTGLHWVAMAPAMKAKTAEEVVAWFSKTMSVTVQATAVANARPNDWMRARRITRMAVGLLDRATAVASPREHEAYRDLFKRLSAVWARLLLPVILVVVQDSEKYHAATKTLFAAAGRIRREAGPVQCSIADKAMPAISVAGGS